MACYVKYNYREKARSLGNEIIGYCKYSTLPLISPGEMGNRALILVSIAQLFAELNEEEFADRALAEASVYYPILKFYKVPREDLSKLDVVMRLCKIYWGLRKGNLTPGEARIGVQKELRMLYEDFHGLGTAAEDAGATYVAALVYDRLGEYGRSVAYWRMAVSVDSAAPLWNAVNVTAYGTVLGQALRSSLCAGFLSDASAYAHELYWLTTRNDGPRYVLTVENVLDLAIAFYLVGDRERAGEMAALLEGECERRFAKVVRCSELPLLVSRQIVATLLRESDDDNWASIAALARYRQENLPEILGAVEVLVGMWELAAERGEKIETKAVERLVEVIESWKKKEWSGVPFAQYRLLRAWSAAQVALAQDALARNELEETRARMERVSRRWSEYGQPVEPLVAQKLRRLQMELDKSSNVVMPLAARRDYCLALLDSTLRMIRWGSLGLLDASLKEVRRAEAEYLRAAWAEGAAPEDVFALINARHRLDYRATLAESRRRQEASLARQVNREQRSARRSQGEKIPETLEGVSPAWFSSYTNTSYDILAAYGHMAKLLHLGETTAAETPYLSVAEESVRRWVDSSAWIAPDSAIVEYVRLEIPGQAARYMAFVIQPAASMQQPRIDWLDLGQARQIDTIAEAWRRSIEIGATDTSQGVALRKRLWEPVESYFGPEVRYVYIVPDGPLCRLPWCALPGRRAEAVLLEEYTMALLPYGAFLGDREYWQRDSWNELAVERFLLVGNVDYDRRQLPAGVHDRSPTRKPPTWWPSLPATLTEIDGIRPFLPDASVVRLTGRRASVEGVLHELTQARMGPYSHTRIFRRRACGDGSPRRGRISATV
ncbi:MAG: hypothetical protein KatS3mg110_0121 [Pirellulaceae bacterium]|nr:MAG: hypothetical protein KatS3mg110_0121 [Pirellulaceae bacterium]